MKRRQLLVGSLGGVALVALSRLARANGEAPKELRIGYQKNGVLVIARQQAVLEKHLAPHGRRREVGGVHLRSAAARSDECRQHRSRADR